jgi:hypothetical protein
MLLVILCRNVVVFPARFLLRPKRNCEIWRCQVDGFEFRAFV